MKLSTLTDNIKLWIDKLNEPIVDTTFSDYYNGSDNELENIFLEIQKLTIHPVNIFGINDYQRRLDFLANEGLNILSFSEKPKSFKVTPKEADELILNLAKKNKYKKVAKTAIKKNLKEAYKSYKKTVISSANLDSPKIKKNK
jgi:hypothetical protein